MTPDSILFVISQPYLSARRQADLAKGLIKASTVPARFIRLEGMGETLPVALDGLAEEGFESILVQPVGLGFSDSLLAWLPGALAHWLESKGPTSLRLAMGTDQCKDETTLSVVTARALEQAEAATPIQGIRPLLGKRGWANVPAYTHHLLVCAGPRCHYRDAPTLRASLAQAVEAAGLTRQCQITQTGCLYPCNQGPVVVDYPQGRWYRLENSHDVQQFVSRVLKEGEYLPALVIHDVNSEPAAEPADY